MIQIIPEQSVLKLDLGAVTVSVSQNDQALDHLLFIYLFMFIYSITQMIKTKTKTKN